MGTIETVMKVTVNSFLKSKIEEFRYCFGEAGRITKIFCFELPKIGPTGFEPARLVESEHKS